MSPPLPASRTLCAEWAAAFFLVSAAAVPVAMFRVACIEEDEDRECKTDCDFLDSALKQIRNPTLAGLADEDVHRYSLAAGADVLLRKPCSGFDLLARTGDRRSDDDRARRHGF